MSSRLGHLVSRRRLRFRPLVLHLLMLHFKFQFSLYFFRSLDPHFAVFLSRVGIAIWVSVGGICEGTAPAAGILPISRHILCQGPIRLIVLAVCSKRLRRITCTSHTFFAEARTIDCKYFDFGNDTCPFGTNCFYKENTEWVDWHRCPCKTKCYGEYTQLGLWAHGSLERDDEDIYFDDESAEVVISSLRLGDDQDSSSLFTNSNWFAFEDERAVNDRSTGFLASPSPNSDDADEVVVGESEDLADEMASLQFSGSKCDDTQEMNSICLGNGPVNEPNETSGNLSPSECEKPFEWVEWRETVDLIDENGANTASSAPNGDFEIEAFDSKHDNGWASDKTEPRIQL
ncbi:hypothetical protein HPP92_009151 [Vanilla planifolia]|uniref:C3H1-type domain-containing protein n=1 Tax=Vanilla planifolia TaxID=51239 RepID=A0A835R7A0_VANPL|nr:hypothetical protein HPP92_009151 [Vanilla planifolia]